MFKFNFKRIFALVGVCVLAFFAFPTVSSAEVGGGFRTLAYDVKADVSQEGYMDMEEEITVDFFQARHGIYFYVDLAPKGYITVDGKKYDIAQNVNITDIEVSSDQPGDYEKQQADGNLILKIGDENQLITGQATYKIKYRMELTKDSLKEFDYVYLNLFPTGWETGVEQFTVTVNLPPGYQEDSMNLESNEEFLYETSMENEQFNLTGLETVPAGSYATFQVVYPEGFFENGFNPNGIYIIMTIVAGVALILGFLIKIIFGRKKPIFPTVEFHPPNGLSPAELGYVVDRTIDKQDIISLIIYFANQGFLDIQGKDKKDMVLIKKKDLPPDAPQYEQIFFYGLFGCGDGMQVQISQIGQQFGIVYKETVDSLATRFKEPHRRLKSRKNLFFRGLGRAMALTPFILFALFVSLMVWGAWKFVVIPAVILFLLSDRKSATYKKKDVYSKKKYILLSLAWSLAFALIMMASLVVVQKFVFFYLLNIPVLLAMGAFTLASTATLTIVNSIDRRSEYLNQMLGKIVGFRNFIEKAELDRLNALVEEDPQYFYHILPYAYSLGLSDQWAKNFEKIPVTEPLWGRDFHGPDIFDVVFFMSYFSLLESSMMENIASQIPDELVSIAGAAIGGAIGGRGGGSW